MPFFKKRYCINLPTLYAAANVSRDFLHEKTRRVKLTEPLRLIKDLMYMQRNALF